MSTNTSVALVEGTGVIGATRGTVNNQFAKNIAAASDASILTGSYLRLTPVA